MAMTTGLGVRLASRLQSQGTGVDGFGAPNPSVFRGAPCAPRRPRSATQTAQRHADSAGGGWKRRRRGGGTPGKGGAGDPRGNLQGARTSMPRKGELMGRGDS